MLSDFITLENFYGTTNAALFWEDLSPHYEPAAIQNAVREGHLSIRRIGCGPDCGRLLFALTENGRRAASVFLV